MRLFSYPSLYLFNSQYSGNQSLRKNNSEFGMTPTKSHTVPMTSQEFDLQLSKLLGVEAARKGNRSIVQRSNETQTFPLPSSSATASIPSASIQANPPTMANAHFQDSYQAGMQQQWDGLASFTREPDSRPSPYSNLDNANMAVFREPAFFMPTHSLASTAMAASPLASSSQSVAELGFNHQFVSGTSGFHQVSPVGTQRSTTPLYEISSTYPTYRKVGPGPSDYRPVTPVGKMSSTFDNHQKVGLGPWDYRPVTPIGERSSSDPRFIKVAPNTYVPEVPSQSNYHS